MSLSTRTLLSAVALGAGAVAPTAQAAIAYTLASGGNALVRFDTATPGAVTTIGLISGATTNLDGLDFRPANGLLYGYSDQTDSVFTVDTSTGVATLVTAISAPTNTSVLGIDFNPAADRLRIVTDTDQNLRVNVAGGATIVDGALAYAAGDVNAGANPNIIDAAYTNSDTNPATGTTLFYLDYVLNTLVSTSNPNAGTLNTIGALGVDFSNVVGFDILTDFGVNSAFATLRIGSLNGLYNINLATGAATLIGAVGDSSSLWGLAIVPGTPVLGTVPEPGSLALLGIAGLAALGVRRRAPKPAGG